MPKRAPLEIIAALLILLLAYASFSKLMDMTSFRAHLQVTPYIGHFAPLLSVLLPAGELLIVALLLLPKTRLAGMWLSFAAMSIFTIYVGLMLLTQPHLPCTCGGLIQKLSWPQHLVLNIVFTLVSLAGIILYKRERSNESKKPYDFSVHIDNV